MPIPHIEADPFNLEGFAMSATIFNFPPARRGGALRRMWQELCRNWRAAERVVASRRNLARLDDRMLSDIGISHAQAEFEASRKPWELWR